MRKIITLLLAFAMTLSVCMIAVSCGNSDIEETTTTTTTETTATTETTTTKSTESSETTTTSTKDEEIPDDPNDLSKWNGKTALPGYLDVDFGGKVFLINSRTDESTGGWNNGHEIWVESITNDTMNDAVYERNKIMSTLYNCTIKVDDSGDDAFNADLASGGGKYIGKCAAYQLASGFAGGNYYNVLNLDIDYTQPWWDQAFFKDLSCNGKLYGLSGDFAFHAMEAIWILFYNKDIFENNFPDVDIYQLVRDKQWTIDKLLEFCQKATKDNDGDQNITYSTGANADTVGLITTAHNYRGLYNACGEFYVGKNESGKMICSLTERKGSDVIDKIRTLTTSDAYLEIGYTSVNQAMKNGTALFAGQVLNTLSVMAEVDDLRMGVVPQPLYDENQSAYYHYVNNQAAFYAIPTSYGDIDVIEDFYTLFAAHSNRIVYSAFVNMFKYTYASDEESAEMIDIVIRSRTYDPGYHYNMALGFDGVLPSMCGKTGKNQFSAASQRYSAVINELISAYENRIAQINDPV